MHDAPKLAPVDATTPNLKSTEWQLLKDQENTAVYDEEILKLKKAGYLKKIPPATVNSSSESWYLPHR